MGVKHACDCMPVRECDRTFDRFKCVTQRDEAFDSVWQWLLSRQG